MGHKRVADVMTSDVVTVRTGTPFEEVVRTLAAHGISGVPVLDDEDHLAGMITEADLLDRQAQSAEPSTVRRMVRHKRVASQGIAPTAADLMTSPVVTLTLGDRLTTAAAVLARHDIKRAPVLDQSGELAGILDRKDLLSIYLRPPEEIAAEVRDNVLIRSMCVRPADVHVAVTDGIVTLSGQVERQSMIEIISVLTGAVDGVVDVHNELTARNDDTHTPRPQPENTGILYTLLHRGPTSTDSPQR